MPQPPLTQREQELADYLLSDEYKHLLLRAVAARMATSTRHFEQHRKALALLRAAFPGLDEL